MSDETRARVILDAFEKAGNEILVTLKISKSQLALSFMAMALSVAGVTDDLDLDAFVLTVIDDTMRFRAEAIAAVAKTTEAT
jgi:hypothetical protein